MALPDHVVPKHAPKVINMQQGVTMTFIQDNKFATEVVVTADAKKFGVPAHLHLQYDEIFRIISGKAKFTLGKKSWIATAEDGDILIPKGTSHSFWTIPGEAVTFREGTEPADDSKEIFFRNMFVGGKMPTNPLFLFTVFAQHDTYISVGSRPVEKAIMAIGSGLGRACGFKPRYTEKEK